MCLLVNSIGKFNFCIKSRIVLPGKQHVFLQLLCGLVNPNDTLFYLLKMAQLLGLWNLL